MDSATTPLAQTLIEFPMDDSTQWYDIDGDGYGDNPAGVNYDAFLAEPSQWYDSDNDGCGDNPLDETPACLPERCQPNALMKTVMGMVTTSQAFNPDPFLFDRDNDGYNDSIDVRPDFRLTWRP